MGHVRQGGLKLSYTEIVGCKQQLTLGMELKSPDGVLVTVVHISTKKCINDLVTLSINGELSRKRAEELIGYEIV